jgi:DNA-binding CsgD family transcriptional regulator
MTRPRSELWSFVEMCDRATQLEQLRQAFLGETERLGFAYASLASNVDPLAPGPYGVIMNRMPEGWVARYSEQAYHRIDPVFEALARRATPFSADDPAFQAGLSEPQARMMQEVYACGLTGGLTIPIRSPGAIPALCALFEGENDVPGEHYFLAHAMAVYAHEAARRVLGAPRAPTAGVLSERERQCLTLAARGKSDWAMGELLGLSEGAAHKIVERAKRKLGVATRVQAVVRALHIGEISLGEAID